MIFKSEIKSEKIQTDGPEHYKLGRTEHTATGHFESPTK